MAKRASKVKKEEIDILNKLRFIQLAQSDTGAPHQTHCRISGNTIVAYDGVLAAGTLLTDNWPETCPNTYQFIHALERANDASAMIFENNTLTVKTSKFRAIVPCVPAVDLMHINPDSPAYPLNNDFRVAAEKASIYTKEGAQTVVAASIMTRNGSLVGTNGNCLIEVAHGCPTPPGLIVPKSFIDALAKVKQDITMFGYSDTSLTVWFGNLDTWLKTQLYSEPWPNIDLILSYTESAHTTDVPKDFFAGVKSVAPFSEDGRIYFGENIIRSHLNDGIGADFVVKGIPADISFNYRYLLALENLITHIDFTGNERVISFFGDKLRGAIARSK